MRWVICEWTFQNTSLMLCLIQQMSYSWFFPSGVASIGPRGVECPPWQQKNCQKLGKRRNKIRKKRGKIGKKLRKRGKSGRKGQNREGSLCPSWQIGLAMLLFFFPHCLRLRFIVFVDTSTKGVTLVYLNTVIRWTRFKAAKPLSYKKNSITMRLD